MAGHSLLKLQWILVIKTTVTRYEGDFEKSTFKFYFDSLLRTNSSYSCGPNFDIPSRGDSYNGTSLYLDWPGRWSGLPSWWRRGRRRTSWPTARRSCCTTSASLRCGSSSSNPSDGDVCIATFWNENRNHSLDINLFLFCVFCWWNDSWNVNLATSLCNLSLKTLCHFIWTVGSEFWLGFQSWIVNVWASHLLIMIDDNDAVTVIYFVCNAVRMFGQKFKWKILLQFSKESYCMMLPRWKGCQCTVKNRSWH